MSNFSCGQEFRLRNVISVINNRYSTTSAHYTKIWSSFAFIQILCTFLDFTWVKCIWGPSLRINFLRSKETKETSFIKVNFRNKFIGPIFRDIKRLSTIIFSLLTTTLWFKTIHHVLFKWLQSGLGLFFYLLEYCCW